MAGTGGADHLSPVVIAVGHEGRGPGKTRLARIKPIAELQPLVTINGGAGHRTKRARMVHNAANKVVGQLRATQTAFVLVIDKEVFA